MKQSMLQTLVLSLILLLLSSCAMYERISFANQYGDPSPKNRIVESLPADTVDYWSEVKPIIESRCVVCHACYDAPCQLKMTSIEGIERGANTTKIYNPYRITAGETSRLHEDAFTTEQWRQKDFYPVLNEHDDSLAAQKQASLIHRMLSLKKQHPLPTDKLLSDDFSLSLNRSEQCSSPEGFDGFAKDHPLWGMPYALPAISNTEHSILSRWIEQGAPYTARPAIELHYQQSIALWETYLNQDSLKQQLASRYIYEHLFLGHIYFDELTSTDNPRPKFFKLQRSLTPPGEAIQLISTRRPYDDPGVARVYYRLAEEKETIVDKTHTPYAFNKRRMEFWTELFLDAEYNVTQLPDYQVENASNPFLTYAELPIKSRHKFLLDEAKFTVSGFIKGPVCRGQQALNVINDNFWVYFSNPDLTEHNFDQAFFNSQAENLALPAVKNDVYMPLTNWRNFSKKERRFIDAKVAYIEQQGKNGLTINMDLIWDGDGHNKNAALTIFRHFDSATVEQGLIGPTPKTAWVLNYHLLERIHYLLVAGYDVYGNLGHQYVTRTYMDFLRMEGESAFLFLLPETAQKEELAYWYKGAEKDVVDYMTVNREHSKIPNSIVYTQTNPKHELFDKLQTYLQPVLNTDFNLANNTDKEVNIALDLLSNIKGLAANQMPESAFVHIKDSEGSEYFTILRHKAHINMTSMFKEQKNRDPEHDRLSAHPGFIGSYPHIFFDVKKQDLPQFINAIEQSSTPENYAKLVDKFGIRRTDANFWQHSDQLHQTYQQEKPIVYGVLDYNRLQNR